MKIALIYTSHEGQTKKIMERIQAIIGSECECDKIKLMEQPDISLSGYEGVIIGTSIRFGFYHRQIKRFIEKHYKTLETLPNAFFGVNLVARKPDKNTPETNNYTRKFLSKLPWQPKLSAVFAGALYYPRYKWYERIMIQLIMWLTKGETNTKIPVIEYTDWVKVDAFAKQFKTECLLSVRSMPIEEPDQISKVS